MDVIFDSTGGTWVGIGPTRTFQLLHGINWYGFDSNNCTGTVFVQISTPARPGCTFAGFWNTREPTGGTQVMRIHIADNPIGAGRLRFETTAAALNAFPNTSAPKRAYARWTGTNCAAIFSDEPPGPAACSIPGMNRLRVGNLSIPLTAAKTTTPAIHVRNAGGICYAPLTQGRATGALNVNISGTIWHAT